MYVCQYLCVCVHLLRSVSLHFRRGECRRSISAHRCCSEPQRLRSGGRHPTETGAACLSGKNGREKCVSWRPAPPTLSLREGARCISKTHRVTEESLEQTEVVAIPFTGTETTRERKKMQRRVFSLPGTLKVIGIKMKL